jgi:hypothetical protein
LVLQEGGLIICLLRVRIALLASAGLVMNAFGRTRVSPKAQAPLNQFWEGVDFVSNILIFFATGLIAIGTASTCFDRSIIEVMSILSFASGIPGMIGQTELLGKLQACAAKVGVVRTHYLTCSLRAWRQASATASAPDLPPSRERQRCAPPPLTPPSHPRAVSRPPTHAPKTHFTRRCCAQIAFKERTLTSADWLYMLSFVAVLYVIRALLVAASWPLLRRGQYGLTVRLCWCAGRPWQAERLWHSIRGGKQLWHSIGAGDATEARITLPDSGTAWQCWRCCVGAYSAS